MAIRLKLPGSFRIRLAFAVALLAGSFILGLVNTGPSAKSEPDAAVVPTDVRPAFPQPIRGEAVRSKVIELMGMDAIPPEDIPFSMGETTRTEDGLLRTPVTFLNSLGETVAGILLIPAGDRRRIAGGSRLHAGDQRRRRTIDRGAVSPGASGHGTASGMGPGSCRDGVSPPSPSP